MRKFAKDLAFVRRYHKIPAELDRAALYFGGREALERAIEEALARDVFERNIRTEAEYRTYDAEVARTLFEKGHALTQTVVRIVELHAKLRAELAKGSGSGSGEAGGGGAVRAGAKGEGRAPSRSAFTSSASSRRGSNPSTSTPLPPTSTTLCRRTFSRSTRSRASPASRATSKGS